MLGALAATVGQRDLVAAPRGEEMEEKELDQEKVGVETEGGEQKDTQEGGELPAEAGELAEEVQAAEIGFKKVLKFVGLRFAVKKEKQAKSEPVQLVTVTKEGDGAAGEEDDESKPQEGGSPESNGSPVTEDEGSSPEVLSPAKAAERTDQEEPKAPEAEECPATMESGLSPAEATTVDSPLKRFFKQGLFLGLRRKQSFKKAKDETVEESGEQPGSAESGESEQAAQAPEVQPPSRGAAEALTDQAMGENKGAEEDFEDLTAELASIGVAAADGTKAPDVRKDDAAAEPMRNLGTTDSAVGQPAPSPGTSPEGQAGLAAHEGPVGPQAEGKEVPSHQPTGETEGELVPSPKSKQQESPLKKLLLVSSIRMLSGKKEKGKKGDDMDDEVRLQSSTESESSPDSLKPDSPPAFPQIAAEVAESSSLPAEQEELDASGDSERKREAVTAWASFKKLVTPRKRPKGLSDSDRDEEQTEKAKSTTVVSAESTSSETQEEPKSNGEEPKLEQSTEDPRKRADVPVTWEALICMGSSKKRAKKLPDLELQKSNEEAQGPEAKEHTEDPKVDCPPGPEPTGASPETAESPVEGEATDGIISTWESFKRLMTPRRKSKSKLEEQGEESVPCPEAVAPETEPTKEDSWASLRKLISGRRKKKSDPKPELLQSDLLGKENGLAELVGSRREEESETPAVVPLSEYDAVDREREHEERLKAGVEAAQVTDGGLTVLDTAPLEAIKGSTDERSPSWISVAVSDLTEEVIEGDEGRAEEMMVAKRPVVLGEVPTSVERDGDISPDEVAEEAREPLPKAAVAEESITEETAEMVSAVSQLTETPVTTAEGTPVQEEEATDARQTQEVLEEVADKVQLPTDPFMPCGHDVAQVDCRPELVADIGAEKSPSDSGVPELAREIAGTPSMVLSPEPVGESSLQTPPSELARTEMHAGTQCIEAESSATCLAVAQDQSLLTAHAGKMDTPQGAEAMGALHKLRESIVAQEHGGELTEEAEKVETMQKMILEHGEGEDIVSPEDLSIQIGKEGDQRESSPHPASAVEVVGSEQVLESTATGTTPAQFNGKDEVVVEQVGGVAEQVEGGRGEIASAADVDKGPETGAEKMLGECREVGAHEIWEEHEKEEGAQTPAKVEERVTEVEHVKKSEQVVLPAGMSKAEVSEEHIEVPPVVRVTKILPGEEAITITAAEVTEIENHVEPTGITPAVVCSEMSEFTPVGVSEAPKDDEPTGIIPTVGLIEAVCGEKTLEASPVGETEASKDEDPTVITSAAGMTKEMCSETSKVNLVEGTETPKGEEPTVITPAVGVTEMVCGEKTSVVTPVGVMEVGPGEKPADITHVILTEDIPSEELGELTPNMGVLEMECDTKTTESIPVASQDLPGDEPVGVKPGGMMGALCGRETMELSPLGAPKVMPCEDLDLIAHVSVTEVPPEETIKVTSASHSETSPSKDTVPVAAMGVGEVLGAETIEIAAVVDHEVAVAAPVKLGMEESKCEHGGQTSQQGEIKRTEGSQKVVGSEAAQDQLTPVKVMQQAVEDPKGAGVAKTGMVERVCEELVISPEEQRAPESVVDSLGSASPILHSAVTGGTCREMSEVATIAGAEVEDKAAGDELEGTQLVQPEIDKNGHLAAEIHTFLAVKFKDRHESCPEETALMGPEVGETKLTETSVTGEPQSTTSDVASQEQVTGVAEPVEEVECKLNSDTPAQDEPLEKISSKSGGLAQDDKLPEAVSGQLVHTVMTAESQTSPEMGGPAEESFIKEQPLQMAVMPTPNEFSREKCEVDVDRIAPTLESVPEVKLHGVVDESRAVQDEMVTLKEDLSITKSFESCEDVLQVTAPPVEKQVIAETVTSVVAEIPEQSAVDWVQLSHKDVKQISIIETAAVIVETAIDVAAVSLSGTPDVVSEMGAALDEQKAESSRKVAECKIIEDVTQKPKCLEEVEMNETWTFEKQSMQLAQCALIPTQLQEQLVTKEEEEKLARLQNDTVIEGTGEVVDERLKASGSQDVDGKDQVMQSAEMMLERTERGGQEPESLASVQSEQGALSDSALGDVTPPPEVNKAECCSLVPPQRTSASTEMAERTQLVTIQQIAEEHTSVHDVEARTISLSEGIANEKLDGNEMEAKKGDEMDQNRSLDADEKQSQEVETESSAVDPAKDAAGGTAS
ncbi:A-kinase anchor protein 12b isoform X2 [Narcine bancroftii]|uniref:A-kinase anchor protein 12b isoform X2 n=1 Tax=Narcine bancroftii TaxID=1343680 RepID=UPI0038319CA9